MAAQENQVVHLGLAAVGPVTNLPEVLWIARQLLPIMHHRHYLDMLIAWAIDNPVRSEKQFPQVVVRIFRHPATASGNGFQLNGSIYQTPD